MPIIITGEHDNYIVQPRPLLDLDQLQQPNTNNAPKPSGRDLALLSTLDVTYYVCTSNSTGNYYFLVIAKTLASNAVVENIVAATKRLRILIEQHNCMYRESGRVLPKPEKLGFDHLFPKIIDDFVCSEQANRRVLVLDFSFTDLSKAIVAKQLPDENVRVDLWTSSWILARLIKLVGFLNFCKMTMPISLDSIILERDSHRLMWLDWTALTEHEQKLTASQKGLGLKQAASAVLSLIGANFVSRGWNYEFFSEDAEKRTSEQEYFNFLAGMVNGDYHDAVSAHKSLNEVVCKIWPSGFHPFTAYYYRNNRTLVEQEQL